MTLNEKRYGKEVFTQLVTEKLINLNGMTDLLTYLDATDFFTAPASTRFHNSFPGGLLDHSIRVTSKLVSLTKSMGLIWSRPESPYLIGLLHDLCKVDFYKVETRNTKKVNEATNKEEWIKVPYFTVDEKNPIGAHGDKSIFILLQYIKLNQDEIAAIRFHMGLGEPQENINSYQSAIVKYPTTYWTHVADSWAALEETILDKGEPKE
jgi:HD superfamily phosphohydrolase YqeK